MPQFAAVSPPPQELLIDFAGDIAVVAASQAVQGEALSKEKNEVQVTMPGVIVSSPIEPERDGLICLDSDSETYAKSNINPKDFQAAVSNHAPVAPVFTPMAMSGAISGTLISFDDDVEIIPMTVAPVMTCLDQKVDEDLLLEDHVVKEYPTATNEVISPALNPSLDETKDSQLGDQGISAAPLESVNTPSTPGNIAAVSTGKAVDAKLSGASPALCSDDYVPNLDTYPCLVDDRSAVLFPVDESPLGVSPKFVVDPDDQASSCLQELRVLLEKHWETTIRV
jgi:hypothetical protein